MGPWHHIPVEARRRPWIWEQGWISISGIAWEEQDFGHIIRVTEIGAGWVQPRGHTAPSSAWRDHLT